MRASAVLRFGVFLAIALTVLIGGHVYLVDRLILDLDLAAPLRRCLIGLVIVLGLSLFTQPVSERLFRGTVARVVGWTASLWMGFAFLMITALAGTDLLLWLGSGVLEDVASEVALARGRAVAVAWVAALAGVIGIREAVRVPRVKRVEIELPRWPLALDGFRIAQLTDIHIGPVLDHEFAEQLVRRTNDLDPDLVAITGDLVDGSVARLAAHVAPFAGLRARHGTYFVTGNHDHYSGARSWARAVADLGIAVLRNRHVTIEHDGASFDLAGVDDHHGDAFGGGEDLAQALGGRDRARAVVLLAHDPNTFPRALPHGVDLQISGHTHGGQIWPFGHVVRLATRFVAGLYRVGTSTLYVSRGTGFWGPPMRLGSPSEITELVLRAPAIAH